MIWLLGLATAALSTTLVLQMAGMLSVRSWQQTGRLDGRRHGGQHLVQRPTHSPVHRR